MADPAQVTERILEPNPATAQRVFGEHYPWIYTFTGEDVLEVTSWNSAAGVRLRIAGRVHAGPGDIKPFSATHTPNTDRTSVTTVITMPAGELLNAIVYAESGAPQSGQTFVRVAVRRGAGSAFERLGIIIQGSVTASTARSFPGSTVQSSLEGEPYVRAITGTTPALSASGFETVPTGARWEVLQYAWLLSTGAVVANRTPTLGFNLPGGVSSIMHAGGSIGASSFVTAQFAPNYPFLTSVANQLFAVPMIQRALLPGGSQIQSSAINLQVGDQVGAPLYVVREWLDI